MSAIAWVLAAVAACLLVLSCVLAVRLRRAGKRIGTAVDMAVTSAVTSAVTAARSDRSQLEAMAADLQRSNAELEQFAYLASHDLQEPLRKVASFCQLLQRRYAGKLDARADQYIEYAVDGAKRMQALINDLLAFSRVGQTTVQPALVSSDTALAQARANLTEEIEKSGATIEAGHLPLVMAELPLLTAVFQNLLSNALKFSGSAPPRILVAARRDGLNWMFSFTDFGIGIEPQDAERVFVLFQRLNERSSYPGTGVGLAMCRRIIEYFGGRIWLDTIEPATRPGAAGQGGTRFCFTLPGESEDE
jgi:light-regulated signal transduction histidine kinase (bacteriophytochrome)